MHGFALPFPAHPPRHPAATKDEAGATVPHTPVAKGIGKIRPALHRGPRKVSSKLETDTLNNYTATTGVN